MKRKACAVSEVFQPLKVSQFTRDELNNSSGDYQNVHYGDILVRYPSVVIVPKENLPFVKNRSNNKCERCSLLQDGDVIIADTAEDEAVGKAIEIQGTSGKKVVSGLHTIAYRPQEGVFAPGFLGYYLNSSEYHNQLLPLMQGVKVLSISRTALAGTVIKFPPYQEQECITRALSAIDSLIAELDEAIKKKCQIKEGLMHNLLTGKVHVFGTAGPWKEVKLKSIASISIGEFVHQKKMNPNGLYPVYNGGTTCTGFYDEYNNKPNKIVMSARCFAGYINKVERPFWAGNSSYSIKIVAKDVDWIYVYYYMKSHEKDFTDNG